MYFSINFVIFVFLRRRNDQVTKRRNLENDKITKKINLKNDEDSNVMV